MVMVVVVMVVVLMIAGNSVFMEISSLALLSGTESFSEGRHQGEQNRSSFTLASRG